MTTTPHSPQGRGATARTAALTALAATSLLLTACGGGSDKQAADTPAPKSTSAAKATPSPTATPEPYTLTTDAHVAAGQAVGGRYRLARLQGMSGTDLCVDSLLGPTPKYGSSAQAAQKNQALYEAAGNKVWATLAHGTKRLDLDATPHELLFLNDLSHADGGTGTVSCQTDLRTDLTASHKDKKSGARVSDGVQEITCVSTVTASTKSAAELTKEDPNFFGRTPDGHETPGVKPTETVHAEGLNFFLVSRCTTDDVPPADFGPGRYDGASADNLTVGHNLLTSMRKHLTP